MSGALGDYLTSDIADAITGRYGRSDGTAYALEMDLGFLRGNHGHWATVLIAGRPSTYRTLTEAKKKRAYLRQFDRRTWGPDNVRPTRIIKITVTREEV